LNVVFVGDIVGPTAVRYVADRLPDLRREHGADLVVANAENCAPSGNGMTSGLVELLFESGVDVITGGNHSWDGSEADEILAHPHVLRPHNVPDGVPGKGILHLEAAGEPVTVLNLADSDALRFTEAVGGEALPLWSSWRAADRRGAVIVDLHAEHVINKQVFAHAVDGWAAAVLGTHTHDPTLKLHLLPGGTALVTDVGMTGPAGGVMGFEPANFVSGFKEGNPFAPPPPVPTGGPIELGAVLVRVEGHKARNLLRLR